jgi:dihydroorotate dehydrogenase (NAD+) catalytic subunit
MAKPVLSVELCGIKLSNPTILASGILGETAGSLVRVAKGGAGAVVTKSISVKPRAGYPNPTLVECEHGLLNAMGLPNPGIDEFAAEMKEAVKRAGVPVIGSIFGSDATEYVTLAGRMEEFGAAALELNLSCPHAKGYGSELGSEPGTVEEITGAVRGAVDIPVFVKLTPNISSIVELAKAAERGGGDAVVAINTVKGMAIDSRMKKPVLYNKYGGYSGPAIKPIGIRAVYELYDELKIPVIGCGGVSNGSDAVEYMLAGARAVEVGSAIYYRGGDALGEIRWEIEEYLKKEGIRNAGELVGAAHRA